MALIPPVASSAAGICAALELAAPDTPPVVAGAVVVGCTGVPALLWAPSPTWVAGVLGFTGVVGCCCCPVCAAKAPIDKTNPKPKTQIEILICALPIWHSNQKGWKRLKHTNSTS